MGSWCIPHHYLTTEFPPKGFESHLGINYNMSFRFYIPKFENVYKKCISGGRLVKVGGWWLNERGSPIKVCNHLQSCSFIFVVLILCKIYYQIRRETCWIRELFIHRKAMVPWYLQLPTYFRIGFWYNEKKLYSDKISKPTVGWQLHIRYHSFHAHKEFPGWIEV